MLPLPCCARLFNPVWLTVIASLALSATAVQFEPVIAKDTAFYFDVAQTFNEHGLRAAFVQFDWPWLSVLFGATQVLTGLPWVVIGRLWTAVFMAVGGALMVSLVARRAPQAAWWAVLVVLTMPALNQFRGDILREHGMWCFSVLAMWWAFAWDEHGGWARAQAMQASVLLAALFRLEALALMPALVLWQLLHVRQPEGRLRLAQAALLPVLVAAGGLLALRSLDSAMTARADHYLSHSLNPQQLFASFAQTSQQFGEMLPKWSQDVTGTILFFGLLGALVWRFFCLLGPFAVLLLLRDGRAAWRRYWQCHTPMALAWAFYFGVLLLFFVQHLFINNRYSALLNWLAVPWAALALMAIAQHFPRAGKVFVAVGVVVMLINVASLSAKKTHYLDAGRWLAQHGKRFNDDMYFDDLRIAWYAGWGYRGVEMPRERALSEAQQARIRYYALEARLDEPWLIEWLSRYPERRILAQFANRKGATVVIIGTCADTPTARVCQRP